MTTHEIQELAHQLLPLLPISLLGVVAIISFRVVKAHELLVIFRLGRHLRTQGPGLAIVIPFIDAAVRLDLNVKLPGWQGMKRAQLHKEAVAIVVREGY